MLINKLWKREHPAILIPLLILVIFAPFFCFEYATDTYVIKSVGMEAFANSMYTHGRLISAGFFYLFSKMGASVEMFYYTSFVFSLIFSSLAVWVMYRMLKDRFSISGSLFFAFFTVLNPLSIEYFLFIEKGFFMLALFGSISAAYFFYRFMRGDRWMLCGAYLCIVIPSFIYQPLPGAFVSVAVLLIALYSNSVKTWVCNTLVAASIYGFGTFLNFLFLKLFSSSARVGARPSIGNFFYGLFYFGALPMLLILALLVGLLFLFSHLKTNGSRQERRIYFLKGCFILAGSFFVTFFPFIFTARSEIWLPFRIIYPLGMLCGTLPILFCWNAPIKKGERKKAPRFKWRSCSVLLAFALMLGCFFELVIWGRLINNHADEALCERIGQAISAYEEAEGIEVLYVSISHDAKLTKCNPWVLAIGDSNVRAFSKEWSDVTHLNVLLGRNFQKVAVSPSVYNEHFAERDWTKFQDEQLVFEGQTLHICVY